MRPGSTANRASPGGVIAVVLFTMMVASVFSRCDASHRDRGTARDEPVSDAPYQADVDEGLGAAVAILVDTSGSMKEPAPGDSRPKYVVAREALEAMLDATDAFIARRPDFPIKIGVYTFSSSVRVQRPIQPYDKSALRQTIESLPRPGGGTAIGEA